MSRGATVQDLRRFEGFRGKPYKCSAGFWTIGYGRNLDHKPLSENEGLMLLLGDVDDATVDAASVVPTFHFHNEVRRDVLVQMAYQMGRDGLAGFQRMIAALGVGDYERAAREMRDSKWWREDSRSRAEVLARRMETGAREDDPTQR